MKFSINYCNDVLSILLLGAIYLHKYMYTHIHKKVSTHQQIKNVKDYVKVDNSYNNCNCNCIEYAQCLFVL